MIIVSYTCRNCYKQWSFNLVALICSNCFQTIWYQSNLQFAPRVISLLEIRLKLKVILQNLGNKWRMVHFQSIKRRKNRIWIDLSWIMGKIIGNVLKMQLLSLKSKKNFKNLMNTTTEHSQGLPNYLVLFGFTY